MSLLDKMIFLLPTQGRIRVAGRCGLKKALLQIALPVEVVKIFIIGRCEEAAARCFYCNNNSGNVNN